VITTHQSLRGSDSLGNFRHKSTLTQLIVPEEFTAYILTLPECTYIPLESGEKIQNIVKTVDVLGSDAV
jgi:hypothetical protein